MTGTEQALRAQCDGTGMPDAVKGIGWCLYCQQPVATRWVQRPDGLARVPLPHDRPTYEVG